MKTKIKKYQVALSVLGSVILLGAGLMACSQFVSKWGLDAIDGMKTPQDPPLSCGMTIPADSLAGQRQSCAFSAGSHASESLGIPLDVSSSIPIRHVIVMMKENRSFDHLFGKLHDQGQPEVEAVPSDYVNPDLNGVLVAPFHADTTCIATDPTHQSASMVAGVAGGAMNGFVQSAARTSGATDGGHFVMSQYESSDLPFYYWLANHYAINDRHFAPMQSGTFSVRNFMMFGTNAGVVDTGLAFPDPDRPSIFRTLMTAKPTPFTWGAYTDGPPLSGTLGWKAGDPGVHSMQELYDALDADDDKLPNVVFVDGTEDIEDDHPTADLQFGEAWTRRIYEHAVHSPHWPRMAIIWTYDEGGGFADHVPPPKGCLAKPSDSPFTDFGPRVPLVVISPWAKMHYVSHVVHDHTAITKFIETIFDLPALTARDANSDALMDMFDFSCGRDMSAPVAPEAGSGGCRK